jgi:hypothetical protein
MNYSLSRRVRTCFLTAGLIFQAELLLAPFHASAANITWINTGTGNWVDGVNWDTGNPPNSGGVTNDVGIINNGGTALIRLGDTVSTGSITLGVSLATDVGNLVMTGGSLTTTNTDIRIGGNAAATAGTGRFDQSGGTVTMNAGNLNVGFGSGGAVGTYNLSGGSLTVASANIMAIGNRGMGTVNQTGGTLYVRGSAANAATTVIQLGRNVTTGTGNGTFTLSGGTAAASLFQFGNAVGIAGSTNTFNLQGTGTLLVGTISVINTAATNSFNFLGGSLSATTVNIPLTNNGGVLRPQALSFTGTGDISNVVANVVGTMTFSGTNSYIQTGSSTLAIDISAASVNDVVDIGAGAPVGTATLAGTIALNLLNGFDPGLGSTFDILTADTIANTASISGTTPSGRLFNPTIVTGGDGREVLRLVVVPEPGSCLLAAVGAAVFSGLRRRKSK